jgi:hypothetical protein
MKPVFQTIVAKGKGDCLRACVASMFELEIEQVPHFVLYKDWFNVFYQFLRIVDCEFEGTAYAFDEDDSDKKPHLPSRDNLINGSIIAGVRSKTYKDAYHAVIINCSGKVIHDPNPNKKWLGINIIKTKQLRDWYMLKKNTF